VPNETRINVPPIGVRKIGVANAIPISPYFFQRVTIDLDRLLKTGLFFLILNARKDLIRKPSIVNKRTLVIIPETLTRIISQKPYPAADPRTGPAINLKRQRK
jgi:hypothetical protein